MSRHHPSDRPDPSTAAASRLLRLWLQDKFFDAGFFIQKHAGKVLFVGILALVASCAALKSATIETSVDRLWVEGECCSRRHSLCVCVLLLRQTPDSQFEKESCAARFFTRRQ